MEIVWDCRLGDVDKRQSTEGMSTFFFFQQKTAFGVLYRLLGSEIFFRSRSEAVDLGQTPGDIVFLSAADTELTGSLYTSDAAADHPGLDPGGRVTIKKKTTINSAAIYYHLLHTTHPLESSPLFDYAPSPNTRYAHITTSKTITLHL